MTFNPGADPFRLRVGLYSDDPVSGEFELYLKKNSGSYAAITTSSTGGVKAYDASSDADDTAIRVPRLYPFSPDWQLSGAAVDLDFLNNRIYPGNAFADLLSCSRASDGYAKDSSGNWVQFSSNVLRVTDLGLLIEDTRTNYLLNSGSPVTQTTESLGVDQYCLWVEGSGSALASAGTATITGAASATEGSPNIFSVTVGGTVVVTVSGTLTRFQLEAGRGLNAFPSSYIPTTSATAVRAADVITSASTLATILQGTAASAYADVKCFAELYNTPRIIGAASGADTPLGYAANHAANSYIETGDHNLIAATMPVGNRFVDGAKVASGWNGSGRSVTGAGLTVNSDAYALNQMGTGNARIGNGSAGNILFGRIRRLVAWPSRLDDATLQSLTTP